MNEQSIPTQTNETTDEFFAPEFRDLTLERNGLKRTFRVRELSGLQADAVFDIRRPDGKADNAKMKTLDGRIISSAITVLNEDSETRISEKQAAAYPTKLRRELVKVALEVSGVNDQADADEKN